MPAGLSSSGFDTAGMNVAQARQTWRGAVPTHHLVSYDTPGESGPDWAQAWLLDRVIVSPCQIGALRVERTEALIRQDQIDHYSIVVCEAGIWTGKNGAHSFTVTAGMAAVIDMGCPLDLVMQESRAIQLIVPRVLLAETTLRHLGHGAVLGGPMGELFVSTVLAITSRLPQFGAADAGPIAKVLIDLLTAALEWDKGADTAPVTLSLRARARQEVLVHIADPALSPVTLARHLGVSRTRLYEALQATGGVASFIQEQRLRAAHAALMNARGKARLADVAAAVGFTTSAHFSRAFRRFYGIAPRDLLGGQPARPMLMRQPFEGENPWSSWIRQLGR